MSKVNTLFNYFTSPKNPKPTNSKTANNSQSPKTPHREEKNKGKKNKGKENRNVADRKRSLPDEVEDDDEEVQSPVKPKKRRLILPDDSTDSEDDFKPDPRDLEDLSAESESVSEGISEEEPETESEEETPEKKKKIRAKPTKAIKNTKQRGKFGKKIENNHSNTPLKEQAGQSGFATTQSWPHLKYEFLQPTKIKDSQKRTPSDPDYDSTTVLVPQDFLNNQTPAMRQWWELKSKHFDCVLFFKLGKFYELYHMDAVISVNELSLTYMRGEFAHAGFPEIGYGRYSAALIERGYKIARIEQTENPEMMTQRCNKMIKPTKFDRVVRREICQISTRGTRVYNPLDVEASTPNSTYFLSLLEKSNPTGGKSVFGVCFLDTSIGEFHLSQFEDDRCNSRLLTLLAHHPPAHIVYERGSLSKQVLDILNNSLTDALKDSLQKETQFWSASTTLKNLHEGDYFKSSPDSDFAWPEGLQPYLNEGDTLGLTPAEDKELAVTALGGCIYLLKDYLLDQQLLAQGRFRTYIPPDSSSENATSKIAKNMVLDAATINNLRIFGEGSLIKKLDHCCTAFGKRLLRDWICRPSCSVNIILQRQEAIGELIEKSDEVHSIRSILGSLPDLERLLSKIHAQGNSARMWNHPDGRAIMFEGHTYSKRKILDFINALDGFEQILNVTDIFKDFTSVLLKSSTQLIPDGEFPHLKETLDYFKGAFDHEEAKTQGSIVPKKGVDDEFDSVLIELSDIKKDLDEYLEKQKRHFGVKVTFHGSDRKRFQIEIPESQVKKVGPGYELQSQRKGYKRYYTAEAKELLARQTSAEEHKARVIKDLNRRIFAQFSEKYDMWSTAIYKVAILDVLISLAEYARSGDMCVPEVCNASSNDQVRNSTF